MNNYLCLVQASVYCYYIHYQYLTMKNVLLFYWILVCLNLKKPIILQFEYHKLLPLDFKKSLWLPLNATIWYFCRHYEKKTNTIECRVCELSSDNCRKIHPLLIIFYFQFTFLNFLLFIVFYTIIGHSIGNQSLALRHPLSY